MSECNCGYYPTVVIPGIGQSKTALYSADGKMLKTAWPVDIDGKKLLKALSFQAFKTVMTGDDSKLLKKLKELVAQEVSALKVNSEGVPNPFLKPVDYDRKPLSLCSEDDKRYIYKMVPMKDVAEIIGEDRLFFFAYNSFGQPYETAKALDSYIQNVKLLTGSDKVNLVPVSLGGSVATAYFDAYKERDDIHRVCYFVPAVNGSSIVSDIFLNNLDLSEPFSLFEILLGKKDAKMLENFSEHLPKGELERVASVLIEAVFENIIVNCPAMWAILPREKYEEAAEKYLCGYGKGTLKAKTERYFRAQKKYEEILLEQEKKGVEFFSICGYGRELLPFVKSKKVNSDSVVDFSSASLGGTAAPCGEKLSERADLKRNCNDLSHNHVSPDGTADVSTSLFPERVFCFKNQQHDDTAYNDVAMAVAKRILTDESFKDVYSDARFPQFNGSRNTGKIAYKLLPEAYELLKLDLHESVRKELEEAVKAAQDIFGDTIIENGEKADNAALRLESAVREATPDLRK